MGFGKKTFQLVLITAAALAVAVPAAGAATGKTVQIAGKLVAPEQVSAVQTSVGEPQSAHLVQVNGELVPPSELSAVEASLGTAPAATSSDDGFDWNTTAIELSLTGALVFFAGVLGILWRRGRLTTA
jgi:hypothetical protein